MFSIEREKIYPKYKPAEITRRPSTYNERTPVRRPSKPSSQIKQKRVASTPKEKPKTMPSAISKEDLSKQEDVQKGIEFFKAGNFNEALKAFRKVLETSSYISDNLFYKNNYTYELESLQLPHANSLKINENNYLEMAWFYKGVIHARGECCSAAFSCFEQALKYNKNFVEAWLYKGCCAMSISEASEYAKLVDEPFLCFNAVLSIDKKNINAWRLKGMALKQEGDSKLADLCFEKILEIYHENSPANERKIETSRLADFFYEQATIFYDKKDYPKAIEYLDKCLALRKYDCWEAWYAKGLALEFSNKLDAALLCFAYIQRYDTDQERLKKSSEHQAVIWNTKGKIAWKNKSYTEAIKFFNVVYHIDKTKVEYVKIGHFRSLLGDDLEAIACFNEAIKLNEDDKKAWYKRGLSLITLGDNTEGKKGECYAAAINSFDRVLRINPSNIKVICLKADIFKGLDRFDYALEGYKEALACCEGALAMDPNDKKIQALKAEILEKQANTKTRPSTVSPVSQTKLEESPLTPKEVDKSDAPPQLLSGVEATSPELEKLKCKADAAYQEGLYDDAIWFYNDALKIDPHDKEILCGKGKVLFQRGNYNDALECCKEALAIDPNDKKIQGLKTKILEKQNKQETKSSDLSSASQIENESISSSPRFTEEEAATLKLLASAEHQRRFEKLEDELGKLAEEAKEIENLSHALQRLEKTTSGIPLEKVEDGHVAMSEDRKLLEAAFPSISVTEEHLEDLKRKLKLKTLTNIEHRFVTNFRQRLNFLYISSAGLQPGKLTPQGSTGAFTTKNLCSLLLSMVPLLPELINEKITQYDSQLTIDEEAMLANASTSAVDFDKLALKVALAASEIYKQQIAKMTSAGAAKFAKCGIARIEAYIHSFHEEKGRKRDPKEGIPSADDPEYRDNHQDVAEAHFLYALGGLSHLRIKEDQFRFCSTEVGGNEVKIDTHDKLNWVESGVYTRTGIRAPEGQYFARRRNEPERNEPEKYGYRWGTKWDAENIYRMREQEEVDDPLAETTMEGNEVEQSSATPKKERRQTPAAILSQSLTESVLKQEKPASASQVNNVELQCLELKKDKQKQEKEIEALKENNRRLEKAMKSSEEEYRREMRALRKGQEEYISHLNRFLPDFSDISNRNTMYLTEKEADPKKSGRLRAVGINYAELNARTLFLTEKAEDHEYRVILLEEEGERASKREKKSSSPSCYKCTIL